MKKFHLQIGIRMIVYGIAILLIGGLFVLFGFDLKRVFFGLDVFKTGLFLIPFVMIAAGIAIIFLPKLKR